MCGKSELAGMYSALVLQMVFLQEQYSEEHSYFTVKYSNLLPTFTVVHLGKSGAVVKESISKQDEELTAMLNSRCIYSRDSVSLKRLL